ncbi:S8 family serine peptidase [bacterium]|nr:S8 family serine peptidase [bacterium]
MLIEYTKPYITPEDPGDVPEEPPFIVVHENSPSVPVPEPPSPPGMIIPRPDDGLPGDNPIYTPPVDDLLPPGIFDPLPEPAAPVIPERAITPGIPLYPDENLVGDNPIYEPPGDDLLLPGISELYEPLEPPVEVVELALTVPLPEPPSVPQFDLSSVEPELDELLTRNDEVVPQSSLPIPVNQFSFPRESQPLIGVIDTGFSANNPDIDYDNLTFGRDWVAGDDNPLLAEGEGNEHGTHILGIIAAERNNGIGIDGINDEAPIWVGRAIGSGRWADSLVEFVDAARESGQPNAVANLSLDLTQVDAAGNITTRYELTPRERAALEYARQNHILVVVASGNDNGAMSALGQASQEFDNLVTVGAAQYLDIDRAASDAFVRADYSSYGYGLDLLANGGTIEGEIISTTGDGVGKMAGSSVAAAKVTGAASQVWAANPELSFAQVKEILKATATDLHTANWDAQTGSGLLNMAAAISLAKATQPETHHVTTSVIPETWSGAGIFTPGERAVATEFQGKYYEWESYTIQSEDTLSAIALATMGNSSDLYYNFIAQKNGIADPDFIITGTTILVPREVAPPIDPGDPVDPINPSPGHSGQNIINAINQVNPDQWYYLPRDITGDGWNETFCNWFVADVLDQLEIPLPRYGTSAGAYTHPHPIYGTDTPNKPYSANALYNHLSGDSMWEEVSAADAVARANQGQVVLASAWGTIGHIAVVRPVAVAQLCELLRQALRTVRIWLLELGSVR